MARILAVDDDPDILALVRLRLERSGHEVVVARDGVEALERVAESTPELAIVDVMMPRMDGHELVGALRAREETAGVPVLVLTAAVQNADVRGADAHLRKPFSPKELVAQVEAMLEANGSG